MKYTFYLLLLLSFTISAQDVIDTKLVRKSELKADSFISKNGFESIFYIVDNVLVKENKNKKLGDLEYNNFQLGSLTSVNTFNSLKINLFYEDFNTAIILDNRLAEIFKIDFNAVQPYKNVSNISTGYDNTLWVFNQDSQQLELYDYKNNTTRAQTLPVKSEVFDLKSNYNYCWLLTKQNLYIYNYFGSLIKTIPNIGYTSIAESSGNLILKKDNNLFYLNKNEETTKAIKLPNLLINEFFVTGETLYIYDSEILYEFKIIMN